MQLKIKPYIMRKYFFYIITFYLVLIFTSCQKEPIEVCYECFLEHYNTEESFWDGGSDWDLQFRNEYKEICEEDLDYERSLVDTTYFHVNSAGDSLWMYKTILVCE